MQTLDLTLPSPAENLALDEALLLDADAGQGPETLRFWMSPTPFVVVGIGGKVQDEVHLPRCEARGIPVLRRCSGGGTVVQGHGCLNYALILKIKPSGPLTTIQGTNHFVLHKNATALATLLVRPVALEGHTDLALDGVKVSGNAQRRLRRHLLFHGTFLLDFDLSLIRDLLPLPALQPAYRDHRPHEAFLTNLSVETDSLKRALQTEWQAGGTETPIPSARLSQLVSERYARPDWNRRR
jgi:lipoate-protein ligase A